MEQEKSSPLLKIAAFIVDKRNLFFLIFVLWIIFSLVSQNWVKVENDLAAYLPESFETVIGLDTMEDQFITYGSANVMLDNISFDEADRIAKEIVNLDYISMVQFDETKDHYNDFSALLSVTFPYSETSEECVTALNNLKEVLSGYEAYYSTTIGSSQSETIAAEMQIITVLVAIIVVSVLLITTDSFAEVPVLIITFLASSFLAKGSNFILGTISFVSDSVAIVLQLALSVDYAVIFSNRYKDEHRDKDSRSACIIALSKSIPEITSSSLTTIGGLIAMMFMQYGIGPDMAIVLIKAIILSLLCVFVLMPGVIMLFAEWMDKTKHKSFIPKITWVGKFAYFTRYIMPIIFVGIVVFAYHFQSLTPYAYGYSLLSTSKQSEQDIIDEKIEATFGTTNLVALIVPGQDYDKEKELLSIISKCSEVDSYTGLASTEAIDGHMLTEKMNAREFAELIDIDKRVTELLYAAYAVDDENYAKLVTGISDYKVPFIDMFNFLYKEIEEGYVTLDDELMDTIEDAHTKIKVAQDQLQGEDYDRILVYLNIPEEGDETRAFLGRLHDIMRSVYGKDADVMVVGEATSQLDLFTTFARDNTVVTVVSILAVLIVLLFTFKSAGMPVLLIVVIEGCIWMNFSFPYLQSKPVFFLGYLIVSSIQMGANIDYAIVVSSRYQEVKKVMPRKDAIIDSMNFAFPTIVTSGTMLAMAGILIGKLTSDPCICGIGECLGRGTIISIITVLFVLPQILLFGDKLIDRTSFDVNLQLPVQTKEAAGLIRIDGIVTGSVNGVFVGTMHGVIKGNANIQVMSGNVTELEYPEKEVNDVRKNVGKLLGMLIGISLLSATVLGTDISAKALDVNAASDAQVEAEAVKDVFEINSESDWMQFAENCRLDEWSINRKVVLKKDINLSGAECADFYGISSFSGVFDGSGHTILGVILSDGATAIALFRYLEPAGEIRNLKVSGMVSSTGFNDYLGGIVAINAGKIEKCTYDGTISGYSTVGGIASYNGSTGVIKDCVSKGVINSVHTVGGIVGENRGLIEKCTNSAKVNADVSWFEGVDNKASSISVNSLLQAGQQQAESGKDIGGIAGWNNGEINACTNKDVVGYLHTGKNVGGIAGRQSGKITNCSNSGSLEWCAGWNGRHWN